MQAQRSAQESREASVRLTECESPALCLPEGAQWRLKTNWEAEN